MDPGKWTQKGNRQLLEVALKNFNRFSICNKPGFFPRRPVAPYPKDKSFLGIRQA
jgi:hypothetical protein